MPTSKFREIVVRSHVKLPALSTEVAERDYSYMAALEEWMLASEGMKGDTNLPHYFEWDEALEKLRMKGEQKAGLTRPVPLKSPDAPKMLRADAPEDDRKKFVADLTAFRAQVQEMDEKYNEEMKDYLTKLHDALVDEVFYVTDAAFTAAKDSMKKAIDEASRSDQQGRSRLTREWQPRVLRHYHAFSQSKAVEEKDIPKGSEPETA